MSGNVVKTEVQLGEVSIRDILAAETARVIAEHPDVLQSVIHAAMFTRPPKRDSYSKEKPSLFETAVSEALRPLLVEAIQREVNRPDSVVRCDIEEAVRAGFAESLGEKMVAGLIETANKAWIHFPDR